MAGNNSAGGRSIKYGIMRDNVLSINTILSDTSKAHFGLIKKDLSGLEDIQKTIQFSQENSIPILPRGGGTSQNGQTVNQAIVLDNSRYLNKIIEIDEKNLTCIVEPGVVLDELNRQLKPLGLWFP